MAMIPPNNNDIELEAAWIVATISNGYPVRRDLPSAPPKTHDFDIRFDSEKVIALEVTSSVVAEVAAFWREWYKRPLNTEGLKRTWSINVIQPRPDSNVPSVTSLRKRLVSSLIALEKYVDHDTVEAMLELKDLGNVEVNNALEDLRMLGVNSANPLHLVGDKQAQVAMGTGGFRQHVDLLEMVNKAMADNQEKIGKADASDRHLFIWITSSDLGNVQRLAVERIPTELPNAETTFDLVWVALWSPRYSPEIQAQRLWSGSPKIGWVDHPLPRVRTYASALTADS